MNQSIFIGIFLVFLTVSVGLPVAEKERVDWNINAGGNTNIAICK
jgi:hypothetical protein